MSNMVKNRFAGLIRGLLRRKDTDQPPAGDRPVSAGAPNGAPPPAAPAPATSAANQEAVAAPAAGENEIALPLAPIIAGLPMDLRGKLMASPPPDSTINLPVELIVTQLAFGAVKITFGELRQLAPGVFANSGGDMDSKAINLPLQDILSRINPDLLARRKASKVEVSDEISGPFSSHCRGVVFTVQPLKATKPAAAPTPPLNRLSEPEPPSAPIAFRPPPGLATQSKPQVNGHRPVAPAAAPPPLSAAPAPVPPAAAPAPTMPEPPAEPAQPTIFVSLWDLADAWPEELKAEISRSQLAKANVPLAGAVVDAGLKRGRLTLTWKKLRTLAQPSSAPSPNDSLELELPLKVVAPLFFAARKNQPQARKAVQVSADIPNLFFGFPQPVETPAARPTAPPAMPRPLPRQNGQSNFYSLAKKNGESNFYVWGDRGEAPVSEEDPYAPPVVPQTDFTNRRALPKDIVDAAVKLPGVAGAVVALPDGLRVASEVIAGVNPDTLAAFIPQIYERINRSTRELRMGVLTNVSFSVGSVPWRLYRVNSVYFAAFGQAGATLPVAELAQLANELDRKKID